MKRLIAVAIAMLILLGPSRAAAKPKAQVIAAKGPIQITLRIHETKVQAKKSLWYKLELKNVGKKKWLVEDWFYKNPWVIHENSKSRRGLYLEILDPSGKPLKVRRVGAGRVAFDWEPKPGTMVPVSMEEQKEIDALTADWKKRGLTEQEQHIALSQWGAADNAKKNMAELSDPKKQLWLKPEASTTTFAWAYTDPDEYADHSTDEAQVGDYTQLWSFRFSKPGTYHIRAVYDYEGVATSDREFAKKHKMAPNPQAWWVTVKTPFIDFEVLP